MAEDQRDLLMKLEKTPGKHVDAECTSAITSQDTLGTSTTTFESGGTASPFTFSMASSKSNYFAIEDFTFQVAISENDKKSQATAQKENAEAKAEAQTKNVTKQVSEKFAAVHDRCSDLERQVADLQQKLATLEGRRGAPPGRVSARNAGNLASSDIKLSKEAKDSVEFSRFMLQGMSALRAQTYPADLDQISVTKQLDQSSTSIFALCRDCTTLASASILRRKPIGASSLRAYMRIDFYQVLITELNWSDDEIIKETFKFVCREAVVTYCIETLTTTDKVAKLVQLPPRRWKVLTST